MNRIQEAIRLVDAAERTVARRIPVLQIPSVRVDVILHVALAGHVGGRVEMQELDFFAYGVVS